MLRFCLASTCFATFAFTLSAPANGIDLQVTAVTPTPNTIASVTTPISITFDRPVLASSVNGSSFRVFGRFTGSQDGTYALSNGGRTVTFTRSRLFTAGEMVFVNLSHDVTATDLGTLRQAGYTFSFVTRAGQSSMTYQEIDVMSNRIANVQTRIYGSCPADLDEDGSIDLTTVNEVSADVRVFLNRDDGSGLYEDFLAPQAIGVEASPNDTADFNNDGHMDLLIAAVSSNSVWVLLGAGDGTFDPIIEIDVGNAPHGVAALDVDGDGDWDIVNSNTLSNNVSLIVNQGNGTFAAPAFFDSGVNGEYGLTAADMNGDGIGDVVVTGRDGQQIRTMLGDGAGGFTFAAPAQASGGRTWVVAVGDLNGDAILDGALANSISNNGSILLGNGDGTFGPPVLAVTGSHTVASDLGDLDGDGDLDWVLSSFGGGFWRVYRNDGSGAMTVDETITAPANPSCAVLCDFDNDGDLDLALTDEIADVVVLMRSVGTPVDVVMPATGHSELHNTPDPFRAETVLRFYVSTPGDARLEVFDVRGRAVVPSRRLRLVPGWNTHRFDAGGLPHGVYHYVVRIGSTTRSDRMVLVR